MTKDEMLNHLKAERTKTRWKRAGHCVIVLLSLLLLFSLGFAYPRIAAVVLDTLGALSAIGFLFLVAYFYITSDDI